MITLMYHGITSKDFLSPPDREVGAGLYDVSIENFRTQMNYLHNYSQKTLLTFDDGEMNNYSVALPVIKEFGFHAYFFIIVKRIGTHGYMGWKELKSLVQAGMTIGSHGLSHAILTNLKDSQLIEELKASKECLERNLRIPINTFSVPRGFCNDKIIQMAYEAGYTHIFISGSTGKYKAFAHALNLGFSSNSSKAEAELSEKPEGLKLVCTPRVAVKANWPLKRFQQALRNYVPIGEIIGNAFKNIAKFVLRESGYNFLRRVLIYVIK